MSLNNDFALKSYNFNSNLFSQWNDSHFVKDLWPVVYILSDGNLKEAYVGETTDAFARMSSHIKHDIKNKLTSVHLITSEKFNKSATLDIESNLIKYLAADGQYKLLNANVGLANHNFYQKKEYWITFKSIWNKLRQQGLSRYSIEYINNSDLFKYSPYKSLTVEQKSGLLVIIKNLLNKDLDVNIIEGGAGTGKTILAIFLFKLLKTTKEDFNFHEFGDDEEEFIKLILELKEKYPNPKIALVIPMSSFRSTLKSVFRNIKGLNANMVIGPAEIVNDKFDIVLVDESHRLRRRVNLGAYFGAFDKAAAKLNLDKGNSELDWVLQQSDKTVLFYDENQSIKPSDVKKEDFDKLKLRKLTKIEYLRSQFRVKGGNDYVKYIEKLLNAQSELILKAFNHPEYEFVLFDSIEEMVKQIKLRNDEIGLSRLVAGFSWKWLSNKDKTVFDIQIGDTELKWNSIAVDWVNSKNSINEVGCIHTTQGYDLNYTGVIFGNEISYDKEKNEIVILKKNYFDINGKQSIANPNDLKNYIVNIYKTIMLRGIKGTYVYVCDQNLREYFSKHIPKNETLKSLKYLYGSKIIQFVNSIPLYDLKAAAGSFSESQSVTDAEWIELPPPYKPSEELFACKVVGESMNKIIPNGSICLFRKYSGGTRNGKIVLVQHTDIQDSEFGSGYTVKEYQSIKNVDVDEWSHQSIILKPLSYNSEYRNIEILGDNLNDLQVIGIFECVLE